jgi:hypothetical protein
MGRRRRWRRRRMGRRWRRWRRHMRRRRRWGRHVRRRRWRRRGRMRRRRWRGRGPGWRRWRSGRRRLRRCSLRRLLGLSVGAKFFLGLRHHHRRGLRMRRRGYQLHRRKRGRGEQQETKLCHGGLDPRNVLGLRVWQLTSGDQQIDVGPDCGGPRRRTSIYFCARKARMRHCSLRIQAMVSNGQFTLSISRGISGWPGFRSRSEPVCAVIPASVAGEGVRGPFGPRAGNSSGVLPGNSSGCSGSLGSWIGGGTSGRGLPGGLSGCGSVGLPGVAGGIPGGSIGIYSAALRLSPRSGRVPVTAAAAIFT